MKNPKITLAALALTLVSTAALADTVRVEHPERQSYYNQFSSSYRQPSEVISAVKVEEVQQALAERGFYRGRIDGQWGIQTTNALRGFQKSRGDETPSGIVTAEVLDNLGITVDEDTYNNLKQVGETADPNMRTNRH